VRTKLGINNCGEIKVFVIYERKLFIANAVVKASSGNGKCVA